MRDSDFQPHVFLLTSAIINSWQSMWTKSIYTSRRVGETLDDYYQPLEKAETVRTGKDVSIMCYSRMRYVVMQAVQQLESQGYDPEVSHHNIFFAFSWLLPNPDSLGGDLCLLSSWLSWGCHYLHDRSLLSSPRQLLNGTMPSTRPQCCSRIEWWTNLIWSYPQVLWLGWQLNKVQEIEHQWWNTCKYAC